MNNQVVSEYNEYLKLTGGDKAAASPSQARRPRTQTIPAPNLARRPSS